MNISNSVCILRVSPSILYKDLSGESTLNVSAANCDARDCANASKLLLSIS